MKAGLMMVNRTTATAACQSASMRDETIGIT